ncbi:11124_t:CDS:2, partial [Scutellospora calospora]
EDKTLFLLAERHTRQKPISGTSILRKKDGESNQEDLIDMETEEVVDPDVEMEEDQNHQDQNNPSPKEKEPEGPPKIRFGTSEYFNTPDGICPSFHCPKRAIVKGSSFELLSALISIESKSCSVFGFSFTAFGEFPSSNSEKGWFKLAGGVEYVSFQLRV